MTNQDTITVELPIKAEDNGRVSVAGAAMSREYWRNIATNPDATSNGVVRALTPAVVEWIERDEWKPLDLPEAGRRIRATLRDGRDETFKVGKVEDDPAWAYVSKANTYDAARYIQRSRDVDDLDPTDIVAWKYEDEPAETIISAEQLSAMAQFIEEQFIEDRCWCQSCGSGEEHVRKLLAKAGLTVAGGE